MSAVRHRNYHRAVYSLDIKRCQYCVGFLAAVSLREETEFEHPSPAVICTYCDGPPHWEHALFVPPAWDDPFA
jgi:hypothetical protein